VATVCFPAGIFRPLACHWHARIMTDPASKCTRRVTDLGRLGWRRAREDLRRPALQRSQLRPKFPTGNRHGGHAADRGRAEPSRCQSLRSARRRETDIRLWLDYTGSSFSLWACTQRYESRIMSKNSSNWISPSCSAAYGAVLKVISESGFSGYSGYSAIHGTRVLRVLRVLGLLSCDMSVACMGLNQLSKAHAWWLGVLHTAYATVRPDPPARGNRAACVAARTGGACPVRIFRNTVSVCVCAHACVLLCACVCTCLCVFVRGCLVLIVFDTELGDLILVEAAHRHIYILVT
jgi:hypothetical protein